ncbi:DNA-binding Lrp family transcriptional regulator, partial [Paraburkholderia sp. WSM4177]|nr:DNA-binding Lrp family transcriptional regulator [Paraburkholderia sp. WSM4177]MBB5488797.1 DNA-binding Lrp family transcriptional regulator [Paraburkholderia sp. WSM4180]
SLHTLGFVISRWQAGAASPQAWAAAVRTLEALRYTYLDGAEMWKPPRGKRPAWLNFDGAVDEKALATAQDIALIWGLERSQFVSRIQVAVRDAMDWMRRSMPPAAPEPAATVSDEREANISLSLESALSELINKIDSGLDTGDVLQDGRRASAALDVIMRYGDLVANAHDYFRDSGDRYEKSIQFRIGWNACLDALMNARAASTATATDDEPVAQWQSRLRDPILPECGAWVNITGEGARSIEARHPEIYEVRALYTRAAAPQAGALTDDVRQQIKSVASHPYGGRFAVYMSGEDARALLAEQSAAPEQATAKVYETYTGQNGWLEVTQEEYDRTKDKYEHRIRRVPVEQSAAPRASAEPESSCDPGDICAGCRCKYNTYADALPRASEQADEANHG